MGLPFAAQRERASTVLENFAQNVAQRAADSFTSITYSKYIFSIPWHREGDDRTLEHPVGHMIARKRFLGGVVREVVAYSPAGQVHPIDRRRTGRIEDGVHSFSAFMWRGDRNSRAERHGYSDAEAIEASGIIAQKLGYDPSVIIVRDHIHKQPVA